MPRHRSAKSILDLPQLDEVWFVLIHQMRTPVVGEDGEMIRPWAMFVIITNTGMLLQLEMSETKPTDKEMSALLFKSIKESSPVMPSSPHRPTGIMIEDEAIATRLKPEFADFEIDVEYTPRPEGIEEFIDGFEGSIAGGAIQGLLSVDGVTPEIAGGFFEAAAEFFDNAPWEMLSDSEPLKITVSGDKRTRFVALMGNGGIEYGLALYETWKDYLRMIEFADDPEKAVSPLGNHALYFNDASETPPADVAAAEEYGWQVADESAYPVPMIVKISEEEVIRPPLADILWYEAVLRAIPIFVDEFLETDDEDETLPADVKITVNTAVGAREVHITLPAGKVPQRLLERVNQPMLPDGDMADFRRAMEGMLSSLGISLGGETGTPSEVDQAQELMYEAWEERSGAKRIAKAKQALKISPDCADAYVLLAQEAAKSKPEMLKYYEQGVAAGERALGEKFFKENAGHFWGLIETRPYMRAREGLANTLWSMDRADEAVPHFQEMLRLNPGDNQGVRYSLLNLLIATNQSAAAEKLIKQFKEDGMAEWLYGKALLAFRKEGDSANSKKLLRAAIKQNQHVPAFLSGKQRLPPHPPEFIGFGDENEAISYVANHLQNWRNTPGAIDWLKSMAK